MSLQLSLFRTRSADIRRNANGATAEASRLASLVGGRASGARGVDPESIATINFVGTVAVAMVAIWMVPSFRFDHESRAKDLPLAPPPAAVKIIDASPRGPECGQQTWPYIDRHCLTYATGDTSAKETAAKNIPPRSAPETTGVAHSGAPAAVTAIAEPPQAATGSSAIANATGTGVEAADVEREITLATEEAHEAAVDTNDELSMQGDLEAQPMQATSDERPRRRVRRHDVFRQFFGRNGFFRF